MKSTIKFRDRIESHVKELEKFESYAILDTPNGQMIADLSWSKSTKTATLRVRSEFDEFWTEWDLPAIPAALDRLTEELADADLAVGSLHVATTDDTNGHRFLPSDSELYCITLGAWQDALGTSSRKVEDTTEDTVGIPICASALQEDICEHDKILVSVWIKDGDFFKEIQLTSNLNGRFLYVHRRLSVHTYDGLGIRVADANSAYRVLRVLAGQSVTLLDTLIACTNKEEKHVASTLVPEDSSFFKNAKALMLAAMPRTEVSETDLETLGCWSTDDSTFRNRVSRLNTRARGLHVAKLLLNHLKGGKKGVQQWNGINDSLKDIACFRGLDFEKHDLQGIKLGKADFRDCNFSSAILKKCSGNQCDLSQAQFKGADLSASKLTEIDAIRADFTGANLEKSKFSKCNLREAILTNANIKHVDFSGSDLREVDLSTCNANEAKTFAKVKYDEKTVLPTDFPHWGEMLWAGEGPDPFRMHQLNQLATRKITDFGEFLNLMKAGFDQARITKALSMLQQESFQLFNEQDEAGVWGIIKSQTSSELVYACKLGRDGTFCCCTQNLNPCGGLRGALCKHILVLAIGLTKAGSLDLDEAAKSISASRNEVPKLDKERMTSVFLKYKGAQNGELDWRPTETLPEDYYAY